MLTEKLKPSSSFKYASRTLFKHILYTEFLDLSPTLQLCSNKYITQTQFKYVYTKGVLDIVIE